MKTIYVDSGFLIALYGKPDEYTTEANKYFNEYFKSISKIRLTNLLFLGPYSLKPSLQRWYDIEKG